jgi:hypothetical protein
VQNLAAWPMLKSALDYWNRKRGDRLMPVRRDIEPTEIPALLPHVQLVELVGDRLRYRLIGTALVEAYGENWTGKYIDETFTGNRRRFLEESYRRVRHERAPVLVRNLFVSKSGIKMEAARVNTPLSEDGSRVSQFFVVGIVGFPKGSLPEKLTRDMQPEPNIGTIESIELDAS